MFCGAGSFAHVDEDSPRSPSSPRGSRRKHGNPYSARGLEEFSNVLADLESRREKIMAKAGSRGVAFVRFVYSNSQDWVPIIVRRREQGPADPEEGKAETGGGGEAGQSKSDAAGEQQASPPRPAEQAAKKGEGSGGLLQLLRWRDSYYWPAVVVLILLCLALFGRVFAICCTSMWWYLVPAVRAGEGRHVRKPVKKDYPRRMSDRRLGAGEDMAPASAAVKRAVGPVDGPASPRGHHAAGKRG